MTPRRDVPVRVIGSIALPAILVGCSTLFLEERMVQPDDGPDGTGGASTASVVSSSSSSTGAGGGGGACEPISCEGEGEGLDCGEVADGCGDVLDCGTCPQGPEYCGGDGAPNVCGDEPRFVLASAVSRKEHGTAGEFDVPLPLDGQAGVECRDTDGQHLIVFSFDSTADISFATVSVVEGSGTATPPALSGKTVAVRLLRVSDVQEITLAVRDVTNALGQVIAVVEVRMLVLVGDTTGSRSVTEEDDQQTRDRSGAAVDEETFRNDVNASGSINSSDIGLVGSRIGNAVP